jgi:hypothetical protein
MERKVKSFYFFLNLIYRRKNRETEETEEFMDIVSPIHDLISDFLSDSESPLHKKEKFSNEENWFY